MQLIYIISISFPTSNFRTPQISFQLHDFFLKISHWVQLELQVDTWVWFQLLKLGQPTRNHTPEENMDSPSPALINHQSFFPPFSPLLTFLCIPGSKSRECYHSLFESGSSHRNSPGVENPSQACQETNLIWITPHQCDWSLSAR